MTDDNTVLTRDAADHIRTAWTRIYAAFSDDVETGTLPVGMDRWTVHTSAGFLRDVLAHRDVARVALSIINQRTIPHPVPTPRPLIWQFAVMRVNDDTEIDAVVLNGVGIGWIREVEWYDANEKSPRGHTIHPIVGGDTWDRGDPLPSVASHHAAREAIAGEWLERHGLMLRTQQT